MLSPKSLNSTGSSIPQTSPTLSRMSPPTSLSPLSSPLMNLKQAILSSKANQLGFDPGQQPGQQQLLQLLQALPNNSSGGGPDSPFGGSPKLGELPPLPGLTTQEGNKPNAVNNVLENYGFELVKQFNEYHQRKREEERKRMEELENQKKALEEGEKEAQTSEAQDKSKSNDEQGKSGGDKKSKCPICSKEFSSIWVLKAHNEEVHKDIISHDFLAKYVEDLKSNMDKESDQDEKDGSSLVKEPNLLTPEKSSDEDPGPPENTSTPKSEGKSSDETRPTSVDQSQEQHNIFSDMHNAFQKAVLSAQQQSQNINPMMLQMAQLQGIPPLVAMNLQPPLISPSLLPGSAGSPSSTALSSSKAAQGLDGSLQLLSKLGIDPKMLAQTGLDPQALIQLGQMDPKQILQAGMDPKILQMLTPKPNDPQSNSLPLGSLGLDPKSLLNQMIKMGLSTPQGPDPKLLLQLAQMNESGMGQDKLNFSTFPGMDQSKLQQHLNQNKANTDNKPGGAPPKPVFQQPEQTKRARTRITDEQLKILRSNFDINNSPTEAAINTMAGQTGLPPKVIKHWFRNTLFKERQRNKDSPYNFNNPPSTMLNLEEYEKTGQPKVIPLKPDEQKEFTTTPPPKTAEERKESPRPSVTPEIRVRNDEELKEKDPENTDTGENRSPVPSSPIPSSILPQFPPVSHDATSSAASITLNSLLTSQMSKANPLLPPLIPTGFPKLSTSPMPSAPPVRMPELFNPLSSIMSPNDGSSRPQTPPNQIGQGKRANRTRFTDYQIKVLQEFFENNAYPKDDDLEYLSKLLGLSPRVIVVWFQNARQKARKIYENQPPIDPNDDGAGRFTRTPGLNYQCKKCLLVFQRYYELIRHQKQHCFKEEDAKRSAQAQKAAAQAAAQFSGQQNTGSVNMNPMTPMSEDSNSSAGHERSLSSPMLSQANLSGPADGQRALEGQEEWQQDLATLRREEEKKMTPSMFDQLTRGEDPFTKFMNSGPGSTLFPNYPPGTPFGMLQQQALQQQMKERDDSDDFDTESIGSSPSSTTKRKLSDDGCDTDEKDDNGQPRDKRLRTTILPEQLDFLYQKYQIESNPSRKMLEQIANEVGLRKRVVQVWFQNTRARERKGQFRAHQQVINKRCPFCPALFKVRSALESHLATKHADNYTRGEINIDSLPDADGFDGDDSRNCTGPAPPISLPGSMPSLLPVSSDIRQSMRKYYEDTMKRYMNDLQSGNKDEAGPTPPPKSQALDLTSNPPQRQQEGGPALDLSKPEHENESGHWDNRSMVDSIQSENNHDTRIYEFEADENVNESGPGSPTNSQGASGGRGSPRSSNKRFRTQMSSVQVKMMKSVFQYYKTPTMVECATLGREIGLQKRVIQVWFQNARAKEKKAKLALQQATGQEPEGPPGPEECQFCNYKYTHKFVIQDHLFTRSHLDNIRVAIEQGRFEPETPGLAMSQAAAALQGGAAFPTPDQPMDKSPRTSSSPACNPTATHPEVGEATATSPSTAPGEGGNQEKVEKALMQLYGMGHGINSFPSGVAQANPFLHPAMFSATGKILFLHFEAVPPRGIFTFFLI